MSVKWFTTARATGGSVASDECKIIFTTKPKGIRINATMTRALLAMEKKFVRIGHDDSKKQFIIQPVDDPLEAFRSVTSKNGGQICSATVWGWANDHNLSGIRLVGGWDEEQKAFVFTY